MKFIKKLLRIRLICYLRKYEKKGLTYGKNCVFCDRTNFGSEPYLISIGNNVRITEGVKFITHDGGTWVLNNLNSKKLDVFGRIIIGNNVHIGAYSIIMPGVTVGDNVVIGCGSVVTKSVPSNSIVAGVPAKIIEDLDTYNVKVLAKGDNTNGLEFKSKKEYLVKKYNLK